MKKQFTTVVPDKLYFPEVSGNTTATFVYDGPSTIKVNVNSPNEPVYVREEDQVFENDVIVVVNANTDTKAAYTLFPGPVVEPIFQEETLLDGSKYLNRTNPSLQDYYRISYNTTSNTFEYSVRIKDWKTENLKKAETMLLTLQTGFLERITIDNGGNDAVKEFIVNSGVNVGSMTSAEVVAQIQTFVGVLETYIEQENDIIVWKYAVPYITQFPEIPEILRKFF